MIPGTDSGRINFPKRTAKSGRRPLNPCGPFFNLALVSQVMKPAEESEICAGHGRILPMHDDSGPNLGIKQVCNR